MICSWLRLLWSRQAEMPLIFYKSILSSLKRFWYRNAFVFYFKNYIICTLHRKAKNQFTSYPFRSSRKSQACIHYLYYIYFSVNKIDKSVIHFVFCIHYHLIDIILCKICGTQFFVFNRFRFSITKKPHSFTTPSLWQTFFVINVEIGRFKVSLNYSEKKMLFI